MESPDNPPGRWTSLWIVALLSLLAQLALCQFFSFGQRVPISIDINPSNLWKFAYHFPPTGSFQVLNWLGVGDLLPFVYPGHYGYITSWPFFAVAAWAALRATRTRHWAYAVISGACCGILVGLPTNTDRGAIDSLLIAALYLAPIFQRSAARR